MKGYLFSFDYIVYRTNRAYLKLNGRDGHTGTIVVTVIQVSVFLAFFLMISKMCFGYSKTSEYSGAISKTMGALTMLLSILNYLRYKGKYEEFDERWGSESQNKRLVKGYTICLIILISVGSAFVAFSL